MKSLAVFAIGALIALGSPARALAGGTEIGGGGKAIVCRDANHQIVSVETLDLWEAREILGLKIAPTTETVQKQIEDTSQNLKNLLYYPVHIGTKESRTGREEHYVGPEALAYELKQIAMSFTNSYEVLHLYGKTLTNVNDSLEDAFPNGCLPEQVVIFRDRGRLGRNILVNQDLVDRMDAQNQAALYMHEAVYRKLRELDGETNSLRARRAVGLAFSGHWFNAIKPYIPNQFIACGNADWYDGKRSFLIFYPSPYGRGFMYKPIILDGVHLTDFNGNESGIDLPASDMTQFLSQFELPTPSRMPTAFSWTSITPYGSIIDQEVSGKLEIAKFDQTNRFALAIRDITSSWNLVQPQTRTYLRCMLGDRDHMFPN